MAQYSQYKSSCILEGAAVELGIYCFLSLPMQWLPAEDDDRAARTNNRVWFTCFQQWVMQKGQKIKTTISVVKNVEILSSVSIQLNHFMSSKYAFSNWFFFFLKFDKYKKTPKYNWMANAHRSLQKTKGSLVVCLPDTVENC